MNEIFQSEQREGCDVSLRARGRRFVISLYHPGGWSPFALHPKLFDKLRAIWRSQTGRGLKPDDLIVEPSWVEVSGDYSPAQLSSVEHLRNCLVAELEGELLPFGDGCRLCGASEASIVRCLDIGLSLCSECASKAPKPPERRRPLRILVWLVLSITLLALFGTSIKHPWPRKISKLVLLSGFVIPGILRPVKRKPWLQVLPALREQQLRQLESLESDQARVARARHLTALGRFEQVQAELQPVLGRRPELADLLAD